MRSNILTYALLGCGTVILGLLVTIWVQSGTIKGLRAENVLHEVSIDNLSAGIDKANEKTQAFAALVVSTTEASQEALRASQAGRSERETTIADLLARPLTVNVVDACVASDDLILEFY